MHPTYCRHVSSSGAKCHGWAAKDGLCPVHAGRSARLNGRPTNAQLDNEAAERFRHDVTSWVAACSCVTGRDHE